MHFHFHLAVQASLALVLAPSLILALALPQSTDASGGNKDVAYGFATGVTGGGDTAGAAPKDITELQEWLADEKPRVILIDKTFDFTGSEGSASEAGCYKSDCPLNQGGQSYIGTLSCGGSGMTSTTVKYDKAGSDALIVASDKTLLGVGAKGVLIGKGLKLPQTTKNVIIRNIHITDINPHAVWGGEALFLDGNDGVWVDHNKFSKISRMFIFSAYNPVRVTISNNEFDGTTTTSATCNKEHYWGAMFGTEGDQITFDQNYWHDISGRSPKLGGSEGGKSTTQATNNLFEDSEGHSFEIYPGASILIEGNQFVNVKYPIGPGAEKVDTIYNVPDAASASACSSTLGRACVMNAFTNSPGKWPSLKATAVLNTFKAVSKYLVAPYDVKSVQSRVKANAGVGKI
ncbi:pectin lyase [Diplocarpon rosae]|nr:pectin lyase [Diplocarpon rosae]